MHASYIVPIRQEHPEPQGELFDYLRGLADHVEVIVVDGSPPEVFAVHRDSLGASILHIAPALQTPNGKVGGVLTGMRRATHERVVIADDDVRYEPETLERVVSLLDEADIVRPQNYFAPLPWHAAWDSARSLLNRITGGDWPGTVAVRRAVLQATGGYDGAVMFENLELVRTVRAAGGREFVAPDVFVRRLPPSTEHFWSQRVRQAYDELARPLRFSLFLSLLPAIAILSVQGRWRILGLGAATVAAGAETGRRRQGGRSVFPAYCSVLAPLWVLERAVCTWLALYSRLVVGGIPYRGAILHRAATPVRELRRRYPGGAATRPRGLERVQA